jgi:hypothetical protein
MGPLIGVSVEASALELECSQGKSLPVDDECVVT